MEIKNCLNEWNLTKKAVTAVVDGAANAKLSITLIDFMDKLVCICHMLNLVVQAALDRTADRNNNEISS